MRRLTKLLTKLDYLKLGIPDEFFSTICTITLSPGETIPDSVPSKSWIFVEEGLLLLKQWSSSRWYCCNMYQEGTSTVFYNPDASQHHGLRFQVEAVEPSTVYYLSPEDQDRAYLFYPNFLMARRTLSMRSLNKDRRRSEVHSVKMNHRISFVEKHYPVMLRVPTDELAELLDIKTKTLKTVLEMVKTRYQRRKGN